MRSDIEGLAEVQVSLYFRDFLQFMQGLHGSQRSLSAGFSSLQKEYDALVPRSRLRLYPRCRPGYGPVALQWGS